MVKMVCFMLCILYHNKTKNFKLNLVLSFSGTVMLVIYRIKSKVLGMTVIILQNRAPGYLSNIIFDTSTPQRYLSITWAKWGH